MPVRRTEEVADEGRPFANDGGGYVKYAAREVRTAFIRKVYSLLTTQLLVTGAIAGFLCTRSPVWLKANNWLLMVSLVGMLFTILIMMCCGNQLRKYPNNYAILLMITVCMGISCGFSSSRYTKETVLLAASTTALIFVAMTIYAWTTSTDFTGMGPYIFAALVCLIVFGLVLAVMNALGMKIVMLNVIYNIFGVMLFTFYIVYDTQLIMGEHGGHKNQFGIDEYASATLSLYLDIINLFLHLLELFGRR